MNPEYGVGDIAKELGRKWSDADPSLKQKYEALAEKDKRRYEVVSFWLLSVLLDYFYRFLIVPIFLMLFLQEMTEYKNKSKIIVTLPPAPPPVVHHDDDDDDDDIDDDEN